MLNLAVLLEDSAREVPGRDAVIFNDVKLNYAQVNGAANQVANGLVALGIEKGTRLPFPVQTCHFSPSSITAFLKAGATVVPLNVLLRPREIAYHLADSDAKAYFCFQGTPELPMGEFGYQGFQEADSCDHFFMITADPAAPSPIEGTQNPGAAHVQPAAELRHGPDRCRRHGRHPYTPAVRQASPKGRS